MKPKLVLTYKCNRSCEFCFQDNLDSSSDAMSYVDYCTFLSWLKLQKIKAFSILGGEPTVHPDFVKMLNMANAMSFEVDVLTNLLFDNHLIGMFGMCATVCANISSKVTYTSNEWELLCANLYALASLGVQVLPSVTIYKRNQGIDHIIGFAKQYDNINTVRIDLARPSVGRTNRFVSINGIFDYKNEFLEYISLMENVGLKVVFDCPFPKCFFTPAEVNEYSLIDKGLTHNECGNIIINPDLSLGSCPFYSLLGKNITEYESFDEASSCARNQHEREELKYDNYTLENCRSCEHRKNRSCSSYCVAERLE